MPRDAAELAHRLARDAEAVCRHYLSNGRREGRYWLVGDARNAPGRSMFVRLRESPKGPAGKWTDAATGEHGDLLDVIRESCGLLDFHDIADEVRRFLSLPRRDPEPSPKAARVAVQTGSPGRSVPTRAATISRSSSTIRPSTRRSSPTSSTTRTAKATPSSGRAPASATATEPARLQRPARSLGRGVCTKPFGHPGVIFAGRRPRSCVR
jgi:hypothetical protein